MSNSKNKNFDNELAIIDQIENLNKKEISVDGSSCKAHITKSKRNFKLYFNGVFPYSDDKKLNIHIDGASYEIKSSYFKKETHNRIAQIPCEHTYDIDTISKGSLETQQHFRMFFFDNSSRSHIFHDKLEAPKPDGKIPWSFNCVRITIKEQRYDIVQHKHNDQSYLIIESLDPVSYKDFKEDSYAIQKGIGFLVGYMPGGENYIFAGSDFIYYRLARKALKSIYHPVTSNPYSYTVLHAQKDLADAYHAKLNKISATVISTFISQIRENQDLSVAIIFLMEAASLKSVVSMPGVFSVILETLANIIVDEEKIRENLITDKEFAQDVIDELTAVINKHSAKIHPDAAIKIRRRLAALNQPVNSKKLTNASKLREPFDQLGIVLSSLDENAINYRNKVLHGNILMHDKNNLRTSKETDDHMLYISAKLFTLISKLVLKNAGYSGFVINHAKFYDYANAATEPHYFEEI
jgi:hypothetical protein